MKLVVKKSTRLWSIGLAIALFLFIAVAVSLKIQDVRALEGQGRLITIHDRGEEKVMLTEGKTIGDALAEAGVSIDSYDVVEPAINEPLIAQEYNINIYRARPVTVIDGPVRSKIITAYQTAEQIAKDAGIALHPEDIPVLEQSQDIISDGAGLSVTIDRAVAFALDLYGGKTEVRTQATTVGAMLEEKGIALGDTGRVSIPLSTPVTAGLDVRVWREGKQTITVDETVPFGVQTIQDADRDISYNEVKTTGVAGLQKITYEIEIKDGVEVSRSAIASIVVTPPTTQVEVVGAKVNLVRTFSADKAAIMSAAGVAAADHAFAAYIIDRENALWCPIRWQGTSGCGTAYYVKFPGAETSDQVGYGLCQSTPAIKMATAGDDWRTNAVTQMKWCHQYAIGRYGSWQAAYSFKARRGWW